MTVPKVNQQPMVANNSVKAEAQGSLGGRSVGQKSLCSKVAKVALFAGAVLAAAAVAAYGLGYGQNLTSMNQGLVDQSPALQCAPGYFHVNQTSCGELTIVNQPDTANDLLTPCKTFTLTYAPGTTQMSLLPETVTNGLTDSVVVRTAIAGMDFAGSIVVDRVIPFVMGQMLNE